MSAPSLSPRARAAVLALAVAALAISLYAPTLRYPMQWDDVAILVDGVALGGERPFLRALTTPYLSTINDTNFFEYYYRPASLLALAVERAAFGADPFGYRAVHTALHVVNCLLVYAVILTFLRRRSSGPAEIGAALGAAAFAVAPYGVDAVLFLTNLGDLLVLGSLCAAALAALAYAESGRARHLAALVAAGAVCVFSKETGACLPAILCACLAAGGVPLRSRRPAIAIGAGAALVALLLAARALLLEATPLPVSPGQAGLLALSGLGLGARYALWPHPLSLEQDAPAALGAWPALGALAALAIGALIVLLRRRPSVALGLAWWAVALLPSLGAVVVNDAFSARYLYVPAAGLALLLAHACASAGRPLAARAAAVALVAAWSGLALPRVAAWSDDLGLWSREAELEPGRPLNLVRLAAALTDRGDAARAGALLLRAGEMAAAQGERGQEALARAGACSLLLQRGDRDGALGQCAAAIRAHPNNVEAWLALGNLHAADGAWDKAYGCYAQAAKRTPNAYRALLSLAGAAAALGRRDEALGALDRAGALAAGSPGKLAEIRRRRALVLRKLDEAERGRGVP